MKVPPKRKGNRREMNALDYTINALNESPSEKEGKFYTATDTTGRPLPQ